MFDTGLLTFCTKSMTSTDGSMPREVLTPYARAYYGERTVSYTRTYEARGADCQIDKVIRVPFDAQVRTDCYVILEDGEQYRVDVVSPVIVRRDRRAIELTLVRLDELLEIGEVTT